MKKIISLPILFIILGLISNFSVFAQAEQEEAQGKIILEKLESKELNCQNLTDQDFEVVGEYFMGRMCISVLPGELKEAPGILTD